MKRGMVIMYKKQMTMQKVICLLALIASVISFVYALGMMTDLYDTLSPASTHLTWIKRQDAVKAKYEAIAAAEAAAQAEAEGQQTEAAPEAPAQTTTKTKSSYTIPAEEDFGFSILYDMQPFNRALLSATIVLLLLACLLFITNTASRRKYYVGNYISVGLFVVASVATAIWAAIQNEMFRVQYSAIDHEVLGQIVIERMRKESYAPSHLWFNLYYVAGAALLIVSVLLILNVIWKIWLMKEEKFLLEQGKAVSK